jgi:hypothetical protein
MCTFVLLICFCLSLLLDFDVSEEMSFSDSLYCPLMPWTCVRKLSLCRLMADQYSVFPMKSGKNSKFHGLMDFIDHQSGLPQGSFDQIQRKRCIWNQMIYVVIMLSLMSFLVRYFFSPSWLIQRNELRVIKVEPP